jgi:hypothetical protein
LALNRASVPQSRADFAPRYVMLSTFDRVLLRLNRWAVIAILAAMAIMVFANVALRFLTDHSILWVEEVSRYLMIWLTFLGSGIVAALRRAHRDRHSAGTLSAPGSSPSRHHLSRSFWCSSWLWSDWISLCPADLGADDAGHADSSRSGVPRDAGRLRPDDRTSAADGGPHTFAEAFPVDDEFDADAVKL